MDGLPNIPTDSVVGDGKENNIMRPLRTVHFNREIRTINGHNLPITYKFCVAV